MSSCMLHIVPETSSRGVSGDEWLQLLAEQVNKFSSEG